MAVELLSRRLLCTSSSCSAQFLRYSSTAGTVTSPTASACYGAHGYCHQFRSFSSSSASSSSSSFPASTCCSSLCFSPRLRPNSTLCRQCDFSIPVSRKLSSACTYSSSHFSSSSNSISPSFSRLGSPALPHLCLIPQRSMGAGSEKKKSFGVDDVDKTERKQRAGKKGSEVDLDDQPKRDAGGDKEGLRKLQQWVSEVLKYREYHPIVESRSPQQLAIDKELAKRYSRFHMNEHRLVQRILKGKLKGKWAAINALPQVLKEHALKVDDSMWPMEFQPPESSNAPKDPPYPPPYIPTHLRNNTSSTTKSGQTAQTASKAK